MWILAPLPGIEPVSPVWEGRFLTTGPPGKSQDPTLSFLAAWCHARSYGLLCRVCSQTSQIHLLMLPFLAVQGSSKICPSILWPSARQEVGSMSPPLGVETNLESMVTIENGRSDMMWLPRLGLKDNSVSTKFSRDTRFGAHRCHINSARPPCCEEAQTTYRCLASSHSQGKSVLTSINCTQ